LWLHRRHRVTHCVTHPAAGKPGGMSRTVATSAKCPGLSPAPKLPSRIFSTESRRRYVRPRLLHRPQDVPGQAPSGRIHVRQHRQHANHTIHGFRTTLGAKLADPPNGSNATAMATLAGTVRTAGSTITTTRSGHLLHPRRHLFSTSKSDIEARKCLELRLSHPGMTQINHAKAAPEVQHIRHRPRRKTSLGACGKEMIRLVLKGQHRRRVGVGTLIRSQEMIMLGPQSASAGGSRPNQERTPIRTGVRAGGRQQLVIGILNGNLVMRAEAGHAGLEFLIVEKSRASQVVAGGKPPLSS
jgi:hypothetical protein